MKIVVGGRFDYIQFAWQKAIDSGLVSYFTNETRRKLSLSNRVRAKIEVLQNLATSCRKAYILLQQDQHSRHLPNTDISVQSVPMRLECQPYPKQLWRAR